MLGISYFAFFLRYDGLPRLKSRLSLGGRRKNNLEGALPSEGLAGTVVAFLDQARWIQCGPCGVTSAVVSGVMFRVGRVASWPGCRNTPSAAVF